MSEEEVMNGPSRRFCYGKQEGGCAGNAGSAHQPREIKKKGSSSVKPFFLFTGS
jgi:hypothetical protein